MVSAAETHHTSKLLVDLSGNPGGFVDFAYLFVRALHPMLPLGHLANEGLDSQSNSGRLTKAMLVW